MTNATSQNTNNRLRQDGLVGLHKHHADATHTHVTEKEALRQRADRAPDWTPRETRQLHLPPAFVHVIALDVAQLWLDEREP